MVLKYTEKLWAIQRSLISSSCMALRSAEPSLIGYSMIPNTNKDTISYVVHDHLRTILLMRTLGTVWYSRARTKWKARFYGRPQLWAICKRLWRGLQSFRAHKAHNSRMVSASSRNASTIVRWLKPFLIFCRSLGGNSWHLLHYLSLRLNGLS